MRSRRVARAAAAGASILLLLPAACAVDVSGRQGSEPLRVVSTSTIVEDWAREVGGARVVSFSLVPAGADPHTLSPGARDVARVAEADLVLSTGLGLEARWLARILASAAADPARVIALGDVVDPIAAPGRDVAEHDGERTADSGGRDPHFWFDPLRVKLAVAEIAARLSALDQAGADAYARNARAYEAELEDLHAWIEAEVGTIPPERRLLATSHDSLAYFAARYGLRVVGTVIPGTTTDRKPTAAELADLVEEMRRIGAPALFTEATVPDRLARLIAKEAGVAVVRELYTGSLSRPGGGASTYLELMRANTETIVAALH